VSREVGMKVYDYVGPGSIRAKAVARPPGQTIDSVSDLAAWLQATGHVPASGGVVVVTFVVDRQGTLRIADRRSEHVACSGGVAVLSAGELSLAPVGRGWRVEEVSNHSTGYCPEPESWPAVARALARIGLDHPGHFTQEVIFRRCPACGQRNIVKDRAFACGLCGESLPAAWNF
jgi:hypothetical protein